MGQITIFGESEALPVLSSVDKPRGGGGRFLPTIPRCPTCGQPSRDLKAIDDLRVKFNGPEAKPCDTPRLSGQLLDIYEVMANDNSWWTLKSISEETGHPEASISAQIRHLRKPKFGSHTVNRRSLGGGLFAYQLIPNAKTKDKLVKVLKNQSLPDRKEKV